ncbi:MAG: hypothetical protein VYD19_11455, partial [Myxococcota bacterium]|nr:hypothetical protein [Myxococcota bacterium]
PACQNGLDDDLDGLTDYPEEPGCLDRLDDDEGDPDAPPVCADREDNDGDGLIDFPEDIGCEAASAGSEVDVCGQGVPVRPWSWRASGVSGSTVEGSREHSGSCGASGGPERIYRYENRYNASLTFTASLPEGAALVSEAAVIYVRRACDDPVELGCAEGFVGVDDAGEAYAPVSFQIEEAPPGEYYVFVDHPTLGGEFEVSVEVERLPPGCSDLRDNDDDGLIDEDDPGCEGPDDEGEEDPAVAPPCWNGVDDDEDGETDYPFDPGCLAKGDRDEGDEGAPAACNNGVDDDEDGIRDFPNDPGCASRADDDETDGRRRPACGNRIDDDQDGLADYPNDPGCSAAGDPGEEDGDFPPACADRVDNDRDGLVDFPFDPGCRSAGFTQEEELGDPPACVNGADDDGDGLIDFPLDPGCYAAGDDDETTPELLPACANGFDNDGDNQIDFPNDPGCSFAGDNDEGPDRIPAACADGRDNDGDGITDLADPGCEGVDDESEADNADAPTCDNGIDDDGDGFSDWPLDEGCGARGDLCEERDFTLCPEGCVSLETSLNCGRCGNVCPNMLECINGFCGGASCRTITRFILVPPNGGQFNVDTSGQPSSGTSCGGGGPQAALVIYLDRRANVDAQIINASYDTYMHLRSECDDPASTLECDDDGGAGLNSRIQRQLDPGVYYVIIDGFARRFGTSTVQISIN